MKNWQRIKSNPNLLPGFLVREKIIDIIRSFFKTRNFHEVFTPLLVPVPSCEPNLEVFETNLRTSSGLKRRAFLITSPEYSLKKLISAGLGNIFEITKSFRNCEEVSTTHNPEFTILEWYRVNCDYLQIMSDFEQLFTSLVSTLQPQTPITDWEYQGQTYDLSLPWPRLSVAEAFEKYCHIDTASLLSLDPLLKIANSRGYSVNAHTTWEQIFYQLFFNEIEPRLLESHRPTIIYDYPLSEASLSRKSPSDPRFAQRFEVFLAGLELGNCFSELTDPDEQASRFTQDLQNRAQKGKTIFPMDKDLIHALESGLPEFSGIAVGVDRLVMLLADVPTIGDTLFFPGHELFDLKPPDR